MQNTPPGSDRIPYFQVHMEQVLTDHLLGHKTILQTWQDGQQTEYTLR